MEGKMSVPQTPCAVTRKHFAAKALSFAVTRNESAAESMSFAVARNECAAKTRSEAHTAKGQSARGRFAT